MIKVKNISFSYPKKDILKDISFDAAAGECVAVLGNNGAGKSTLITCINGIRTPKSGSVYIGAVNALDLSRSESARLMAYVSQKSEISQMTVFDCILLGRKPYMKWSASQQDMDICDNMIQSMALGSLSLRNIDTLSGGELQKVMLARALVQQPGLLLLDEPTGNLDPKNQYEMMALIKDSARKKGISVVIVLHDLNLALRYCDKFLFIKNGLVYKYGDSSIVTQKTISDVYGIHCVIANVDGKKIVVIG